ncbi:ABC-three component system protein [Octadecabacter sp. R77987]|uniref:ABC-three component system protein n=1 Tax=Octadecabacter sp. R77987 TaxID=3093874 RepID=UPI00366E7F30
MGSLQNHDASAVAIAFQFQQRQALFELFGTNDDEAAVAVEALDDIQLNLDGQTLIEQVKHSIKPNPAPITLKSKELWTTLRIWCGLVSKVDLDAVRFVFICTTSVQEGSPLLALEQDGSDRTALIKALDEEASRVLSKIEAAKVTKAKPPHQDRALGIEAWLDLANDERAALLSRITLRANTATAHDQETELAKTLTQYPVSHRNKLSERILQWWDSQMLRSMLGSRPKFVGRSEVLSELSQLHSMLEQDQFFETYSSKRPPPVYATDQMLARQCELVGASSKTTNRARQLEWQARSQRAEWANESPSKRDRLTTYDETLVLEWEAEHDIAQEQSDLESEASMKVSGHDVLTWALKCSVVEVGSIDHYTLPPFYIRGSYQTLSISGKVGWHPDYKKRLGFE